MASTKTVSNDINLKLSFPQIVDMIVHTGKDLTTNILGEMGIGKSSLLGALKAKLGDAYEYVYLDCTLLDLGDLFIPFVDTVDKHDADGHTNGMMRMGRFAPTERMKLHTGKPLVVMLDEIGKCANPSVLNALLPLVLEQRLADHKLPANSYVLTTTNLVVEGVGDRLPTHYFNRTGSVRMRKPTADEWCAWASSNGVEPAIIALVHQYPTMLADYDSAAGKENNPYINRPGSGIRHFVSPRTLALASPIFAAYRENLIDTMTFEAQLQGTIGPAAAAEARAFATVQTRLVDDALVLNDPHKAPVMEDTLAKLVWVFRAAARLSKENVMSYLTYTSRLGAEHMALMMMYGVRPRPTLAQVMLTDKTEVGATCREFMQKVGSRNLRMTGMRA